MFCFVSTLSTRHERGRQYYHYVHAKSFRFMMRKTSIAQKLFQDKTKSILYRLYCPFVQDVPVLFSKKKVINQKLINRHKKKIMCARDSLQQITKLFYTCIVIFSFSKKVLAITSRYSFATSSFYITVTYIITVASRY